MPNKFKRLSLRSITIKIQNEVTKGVKKRLVKINNKIPQVKKVSLFKYMSPEEASNPNNINKGKVEIVNLLKVAK